MNRPRIFARTAVVAAIVVVACGGGDKTPAHILLPPTQPVLTTISVTLSASSQVRIFKANGRQQLPTAELPITRIPADHFR